MRRGAWSWIALLGVGCGDVSLPANPFNKRVPRIVQRHLGHPLDAWLERCADADPVVRRQAAWAVGTLTGDTERRTQAIRSLLADPDPDVRFAAVVAAGRIPLEDEEGAARLVALMQTDSSALRRQARISAAQIGPVALEPLRRAVGASDPLVRWSAAWALLRLGDAAEPAIPDLIDRLRSDPERSVRRQVALVLGKIGATGPRALARLLGDPDFATRSLAERGLRNTGPEGLSVLVALLEGADEEQADLAAAIFSNRPDLARSAIDALVAALRREGPTAMDAADALMQVGPTARPMLEAAREKADPALRDAIDEVLLRLVK